MVNRHSLSQEGVTKSISTTQPSGSMKINFFTLLMLALFGVISIIATPNAEAQLNRTILFQVMPQFDGNDFVLDAAQEVFIDARAQQLRAAVSDKSCVLYVWGDSNVWNNSDRGTKGRQRRDTDAANDAQLGRNRAAAGAFRVVNKHGLPTRQVMMMAAAGENRRTITFERVCYETARTGNYDVVMNELAAQGVRLKSLEERMDANDDRNDAQDARIDSLAAAGRKAVILPPPAIDRPILEGGYVGGGVGYLGAPNFEVLLGVDFRSFGLYGFGGGPLSSEEVYIECQNEAECQNSGLAEMANWHLGAGMSIDLYRSVEGLVEGGMSFRHCEIGKDRLGFGGAGFRINATSRGAFDIVGQVRRDERTEQYDLGGKFRLLVRF